MKTKTALFGKLLLEKGAIAPEQLDAALREQQKNREFLGITLVKLGFMDEDTLLAFLSRHLGVEYVKLDQIEIPEAAIKKVPAKFTLHYKFIPIGLKDNTLSIAMSNPADIHAIDDVRMVTGLKVRAVLSGEKEILEAIRRYYGVGADTVERMLNNFSAKDARFISEVENVEDGASDASVTKFVNQILAQAYRDRATDIHIEPYGEELKIRFRVDGILCDIKIPPLASHFQSAIISRIKIMSRLNIAQKRLPQDGRIKIKVADAELDLRISILPTPFGESAVIRILSNLLLYGLEELGLCDEDLGVLGGLIKKPHGIIFVTGPTGSGKTTTLYTCLSSINQPERKIITIEDPIEYQLPGITQIQINPQIGLTFARGLRSMLRHDPDIMMVGEVRDLETAQITIRVALTGHLVFSTLHTNDAASSITRLLDMGIEPFLVSSSVECFIAQRLVRIICPRCKKEMKIPPEIAGEFDLSGEADLSRPAVYEGQGCEACKFTGYKGRTAIYEFLVVNDEIRDMILSRAPASQIRRQAVGQGMRVLRQDGWNKILKGITTISEVLRVT